MPRNCSFISMILCIYCFHAYHCQEENLLLKNLTTSGPATFDNTSTTTLDIDFDKNGSYPEHPYHGFGRKESSRTLSKSRKQTPGQRSLKAEPFAMTFPQIVLQQIMDGKPVKVTFEQESKIVFQRKHASAGTDQLEQVAKEKVLKSSSKPLPASQVSDIPFSVIIQK